MPKISVIVPIYNVEKYLKEALDSILAQTLSDLEIILINDGSKDKCPEIINEYAKCDNRIITIHKENEGYGKACNLGLKRATGEYIAILEPDDYIDPKMYEDLYNIAKEFNSDIVKSSFFDNLQSKEQKWIKKVNWPDFIPEDRSFTIYEYPHFLTYHPSIWSCIYKKEFLDKNNINFIEAPGAGWVDNPFQVQTMCLAKRINYTQNAYYYWRRLNYYESDDLKDYTIPFKRSNEIHKWLENSNITDFNILSALAKREIAYINIVLGMKKIPDTKDCYDRIKKALNRMENCAKDYKNLPLKRFKMLIKRYRKEIISIKLNKEEKSIALFGKILFKAQNDNKLLKNQEKINLCFAANDAYAPHLATAIKSIIKNKNANDVFDILILDDDIKDENKEYIKSIIDKNSLINFVKINKELFKNCPLTKEAFHIKSLSTYYRFLLSSISQKNKILYLDCDIIVQGSLAQLYNTNIQNCYFAGVEDVYSKENCARLGLQKYCNAGVILLNLDLWRKNNIEEKLFDWCKDNYEKIKWVDQDVLNTVLQEKILYLPEIYNAQVSELEFGKTKYFNEIANDAAIIHYVGHKKPWMNSSFKLNKNYLKYRLQTKYKDIFFKNFIHNIFSLKNEFNENGKYKVLTILGMRIRKHTRKTV